MTILKLSETTMNRLRQIAARREQSIEELAEEALAEYLAEAEPVPAEADEPDLEGITAEMVEADPGLAELFHARGLMAPGEPDPLEAFIGILESEDTNVSETIRETLARHTHPLYGWTLKHDRPD